MKKYITLVIKNPSPDRLKTFRLFEKKENLGEISAMSTGHCLDILDDWIGFIEKLANDEISSDDIQDEASELHKKIEAKFVE